jgi:hypothetical protein
MLTNFDIQAPGFRSVNKRGLADRYSVGVRTLENWLAMHIILARMESGELIFDVVDCDRRLFDRTGKNKKESMNTENEAPKQFVTAEELAKRYGVGLRTITNWKAAGLLVFLQVRRVVRFDVNACDKSLGLGDGIA